MAAALTVEQLFDSIAIRVNGPKAWSESMTIDWHVTDLGERYRMSLSNGVLVHYPDPGPGDSSPATIMSSIRPSSAISRLCRWPRSTPRGFMQAAGRRAKAGKLVSSYRGRSAFRVC